MKQLNITYCKSTGLNSFFDTINQITIHDTPFAGGGFGSIYHCNSFNGNNTAPVPQVVKIFKESSDGRNEHSWKTISKLQDCMISEVEKLRVNNLQFTNEYPALIGLPQFTFIGKLDGKEVRGYVSTNLSSIGCYPFDKIREDIGLFNDFYERNLQDKYIMCYHLARAFRLLMKNNFIHADLSADNIFVSSNEPFCAIIDFDSGAIVEKLEDNPSTWGKPQDWLAPEISFQFSKPGDVISINLFTDIWAVATAINYFLLSMPAYFLTDLSENSLRYYTQKYKWPNIDVIDKNFNEDLIDHYPIFIENANGLPVSVFKEFECTFTNGVFDPTLRTSYYKWELILKDLIPVDKRKISWSQISIPGGVITSGNLPPIQPSPPIPPSSEEIKTYINDLVLDIVFEGENIERHKFFIADMAKKSSLDGKSIVTEIDDFLELYQDVIQDKVITRFEKTSLLNQAKLAMIETKTVEKLIKKYEYRD